MKRREFLGIGIRRLVGRCHVCSKQLEIGATVLAHEMDYSGVLCCSMNCYQKTYPLDPDCKVKAEPPKAADHPAVDETETW